MQMNKNETIGIALEDIKKDQAIKIAIDGSIVKCKQIKIHKKGRQILQTIIFEHLKHLWSEKNVNACINSEKTEITVEQRNATKQLRADILDLYDIYSANINSKSRLTASARKKITSRLKEYSYENLERAIMNFSRDTWWMSNNARRGVAWFFHSENRIDQFLNLESEEKKEKLNL